MAMNASELLTSVVERKASDLHIIVGMYPTLRIEGKLTPIDSEAIVTAEFASAFVQALLTANQKEIYANNKELDFS